MAKKVVRQNIKHERGMKNLSKALKMPYVRHENPSHKARKSRIYRKNQKEQKRFEAPLREFIEIKYQDIFKEYTELYNQMHAENPEKINLKKTKTFKRWKTANQNPNQSDILSTVMRETIEKETPALPSYEQAEAEQNEAEQTEQTNADAEQNEAEQTEQTNAEQEQSETEQQDEGADQFEDEGMIAARQVDELVNQMIREDELRAILEQPEEDEGIELNIHDELEMEFEPFDFDQEMEALGW